MSLNKIKGKDSFKAIGKVVGCLRTMFRDKELLTITKEKKAGWILDFFAVSLEKCSDTWCEMFLVLNPDKTEEDITPSSIIAFAYGLKNDPEFMSLFFSQSEQNLTTSSGSQLENTEETEVTPLP